MSIYDSSKEPPEFGDGQAAPSKSTLRRVAMQIGQPPDYFNSPAHCAEAVREMTGEQRREFLQLVNSVLGYEELNTAKALPPESTEEDAEFEETIAGAAILSDGTIGSFVAALSTETRRALAQELARQQFNGPEDAIINLQEK